jgi:thiamine biosynthesis protein ThiI
VERIAELAEKRVKQGETFAVRARNFEPSHLKGKEIEIRAGAEILSRLHSGVKVNLSDPDSTLRVFYGGKEAFVSAIRFDGPGGLPIGSQGSVLGLATDPALSPLSFFLMMKRGAMVWPVIAGFSQLLEEASLEKILDGLRMLKPFVPRKTYHAYRIGPDQDTLKTLESVDSSLRDALCVRLAFRSIADLARIRGALGLTVADCFGYADLQRLGDLRMVDEVTRAPIYRPLLVMDSDNLNRQLTDLHLLKLIKEGEEMARVRLPDSSMSKLRELEDSVHADSLAQRIAENHTKILIQ